MLLSVLTLLAIGGAALAVRSGSSSSPKVPDDGEPFGPVEPQTTCDPIEKPGVQAFRKYILMRFGGFDDGIVRACNVGGTSEHKEGRAWDWGIIAYKGKDAAGKLVDVPAVDVPAALDILLADNALLYRSAGIQYMIFNKRIWSNTTRSWQPYNGPDPHTAHVHFSFTWKGARGQTTFYQPGAIS